MTTPFISVGSNNQINAPNSFVFGNNITVPTSTNPSNTLYLDPTIKEVSASGLITTTAATYGLVDNGGLLSVGPITSASIPDATPTTIGGVYASVDTGASTSNPTGNTGLGYDALVVTSGTANTAIGYNSMSANTTGVGNVAFGYKSLTANTTGAANTAIGTNALTAKTGVGSDNTAIGANALMQYNDTTSSNTNTAVGTSSLQQLTSGQFNTCVGSSFGATTPNVSANSTTTIGTNNSTVLSTLSNNITVGTGNKINAPNAFVFGNNITVPTSTANNNTLYLDPTITEVNAPGLITTTAATYGLVDNGGLLSIGPLSGSTIPVATPTTIGGVYGLVDNGSSKTGNTGLGYNAMVANTGTNNTAIGESALLINTSNSNNTAIGAGSLSKFNDTTSTTPDANIGIGYNAFTQLSTGGGNVCVGSSFNGTTALTGTNTTTVGDGNITAASTLTENVTIGNTNTVNAANIIVVGNGNRVNASITTGALIYGNGNAIRSPCLIFGNKNRVDSNSPNCIIFGLGASITNLTAGTVYFDPKVTNFHLGIKIPVSTTTTDPLVPLLLDTTSGYLYQSNVPLPTLLQTDFYFTSATETAIIPTGFPGTVTVIYDRKAIDNFYVSGTYRTSTGIFTAPIGGTYQYEYQTALSTTNTAASLLTITVNVEYFNRTTTNSIATTTTSFPLFLSRTATAPAVNLKGIHTMNNKDTLKCTISATVSSRITFSTTNSYMKVILL